MPDPFGVSKGGGFSNPLGVTGSGGAAKKGGGSLVGNLLGDVGNAITGLPMGIVHTVEHPVGTVKQLARTEAQTWGPLLHGDVGKFYAGFHQHPLGPILDVLTLLSAGGARAFALGTLPEDASAREIAQAALRGHYQGPLRTIDLQGAPGGATIAARTLPRQGFRAARVTAADRLLKTLPPETRMIGEFARAARATRAAALPTELRHLYDTRLADYLHAHRALSKPERAAVAVLGRVPIPADLERWKRLLPDTPEGNQTRVLLSDPKVEAAYLHPSEKVMRAVESARSLADAREQILLRTTGIDKLALEDARFRHMRIVRGDQNLTADQLAHEVTGSGRPQPFYLPDEPIKETRGGSGFSRSASGRTPPRPGADLYHSQGVLFRTGMLALHPDVLGPAFIRAARHDYKTDLHAHVLDMAVPRDALPAGWEWVRQTHGQRIPFTATAKGEHGASFQDAFPQLSDQALGEGFTTTNAAEAARDASGRRLAVPASFARQVEGEWTKSSDFTRLVIDRPLQVWRALILNLRIPWLVNNVLGNAFLTTLRFAGPDGLRAFLGMVGETKGVRAVRQLLGDPVTRNHLTPEDMASILPELHRGGTFLGSQGDLGKTGQVARRLSAGLAPADVASESALRRAAAETVLRGTQEAKRIYRAMPAQEKSWRAAMVQAAEDPAVRQLVIKEVNSALGDFNSLSAIERNAIRKLVPFWAWYREITRIALRIPLDTPGRAALLARLGQAGQDESNAALGQVPSYLKGAIPLGTAGGLQRIANLQSLNPLTSAVQTGQSIGGLIGVGNQRRGASQAIGELNPFLAGALQYLVAASKGDTTRGAPGALPNVGQDIAMNLPQIRVLTSPPSNLYPGRTRLDLLQQLLGSPVRSYSPAVARKYAGEGQ